ncbi:serine/threonine-protein kinase [Streptomyces griseiscabiei]|uniref:non-specific serine/threonine protein kinase n=1 Tax=Streptomyces griseiscabiei TaxID=2993540 RepID=A0ABU4LCT9_9ACTN|nr:serine/threonine-protein kinase [Streptomyces griseiscabiei]MBZ3907456.1 serine/threonine protein kinase [Streptomyces griseiscabiei]MDX2913549.1 serine/threonine-protein kinase [Streptomyces griseiscabiei]
MSEAERAGDSRQDKDARLLAGRYRLGGVLGRGGMGTVWRAEDETLGRTVAVKELRFPSSIDADEKRRLITRTLREAKAIARIRNNAAVTVFDVVHEDDRPWIVMELVEGKSLAEVIREDGVLEPRRAAEVGLAILDVLRAAHREGILHRDVKPSNVLIDKHDGRVVLTDFGIAQVEGDPSITSTGMLVGAPSYISPERARGHKPGPAADLWSLGGLLYAAVEGVPPYDKGSAIATLTAVMTEPVPEPKRAGALKDVIFGLLTKDPERRLDDAGARAMLNTVMHAPDPKDVDPVDATRVVPLPPVPEERPKKGGSGAGSGSKGGGGERPRAPRWSMRKNAAGAAAGAGAGAAAVGAGSGSSGSGAGGAAGGVLGGTSGGAGGGAQSAAGSPAVVTTRSASVGVASGADAAKAGAGSARSTGRPAAGVPGPRGAGGGAGVGAGNSGSAGRTSGWPEMTPPDLPPRPVPRAPITDVVSRRTLAVIAVAVVLVVLGTVLALTLGGDDGSSNDSKGADTKAAASSGSASGSDADGKDAGGDTSADKDKGKGSDPSPDGDVTDEADGSGGSGGSSPSPSGGAGGPVDGDGSGGSGSIATETYKSGQGFSIGLPEGWKYQSTDAAGARFSGPDGQRLLVGWTTTPKSDPVADWKNQERYMTRSQYKRIRIEAVDYRGWNAADWEFTYMESGTKNRSIDRGFVVDSQQGYALMYTAKAAKWSGELRKDTWKTFTGTFEPKS